MTSIFDPPPAPPSPLGYHRILSPTAAIRVSPICFGGISLGTSWSSLFGRASDPFTLLDAFYALGGNFIDTSNTYNAGESEELIGQWMAERGNRDEMVVATKWSCGYHGIEERGKRQQSNFSGNSAKSLRNSLRDSLGKLRTGYVDVLYIHWWDFTAGVEEVMRALHACVLRGEVLYLGASDVPAWVVVKANMFARQHGLTPFSVYQGRWNAAYRDMEAELVPMCESEGLGLVSWATLGGGQLMSRRQREEAAKKEEGDEGARPAAYSQTEEDVRVCDAIEGIAERRGTSFQAVAVAYLFAQSTHVFPIVGVQSVDHVKALVEPLKIKLTEEEVREIQTAKAFKPQFPTDFIYQFKGGQEYHTDLKPSDGQQLGMWCHIDSPRKQGGYEPRQ